ncbi:hypothetical protein PAHAL_4G140400 [Panicum hallii]|uniref:Uncharacterized protein n=1 Tax=Panicum hallii TaxID=206008 RepID=A0A2S3HJ64_9POAL|nr:hypothetical protein PAHAL_4G140400 [Panicum hallii]
MVYWKDHAIGEAARAAAMASKEMDRKFLLLRRYQTWMIILLQIGLIFLLLGYAIISMSLLSLSIGVLNLLYRFSLWVCTTTTGRETRVSAT